MTKHFWNMMLEGITRFFYKQHFYEQSQAEVGKKLSKI